MAIPKKNSQGLNNDADNENLDSRAKSSAYDDEADDFDSLQIDDFDAYENDYDEDED